MEPKGSLLYSQQPATAYYCKPQQSSLTLPIYSFRSVSTLSTNSRLHIPGSLLPSLFLPELCMLFTSLVFPAWRAY